MNFVYSVRSILRSCSDISGWDGCLGWVRECVHTKRVDLKQVEQMVKHLFEEVTTDAEVF